MLLLLSEVIVYSKAWAFTFVETATEENVYEGIQVIHDEESVSPF